VLYGRGHQSAWNFVFSGFFPSGRRKISVARSQHLIRRLSCNKNGGRLNSGPYDLKLRGAIGRLSGRFEFSEEANTVFLCIYVP
jgi:hypothetical protein